MTTATESAPLWRVLVLTHEDNPRPIRAESAREAAECSAWTLARRSYGKARANVGAFRWDGQDGTGGTYFEAFIGRYDRRERNTTGRNVKLYVTLAS